MERIHFDSAAFNMAVNKYDKACKLLQACIDEFNNLEMGQADQAVLDALLNDYTETYREQFEAHINMAIEKATKNNLLADALRKSIEDTFSQWQQNAQKAYQAVIRTINDGMAMYIPFNRNLFKLDGQTVTFVKTDLEAEFSVLLDTDDRKHLWQLASETATKLNELQQFIAERNTAIFGTDVLPDIDGHCFQVDENRVITVNPHFVELV